MGISRGATGCASDAVVFGAAWATFLLRKVENSSANFRPGRSLQLKKSNFHRNSGSFMENVKIFIGISQKMEFSRGLSELFRIINISIRFFLFSSAVSRLSCDFDNFVRDV